MINKRKRNFVLHIDTSSNKQLIVSIETGESVETEKRVVAHKRAQEVLIMIDELLSKHNVQLSDLSAIDVNFGPGSFTGLRVGVSIANTLGTILMIPINGLPKGKLVQPAYQ